MAIEEKFMKEKAKEINAEVIVIQHIHGTTSKQYLLQYFFIFTWNMQCNTDTIAPPKQGAYGKSIFLFKQAGVIQHYIGKAPVIFTPWYFRVAFSGLSR